MSRAYSPRSSTRDGARVWINGSASTARVSHRGSARYDPSSPTIVLLTASSPTRNLPTPAGGRSESCIHVAPKSVFSETR